MCHKKIKSKSLADIDVQRFLFWDVELQNKSPVHRFLEKPTHMKKEKRATKVKRKLSYSLNCVTKVEDNLL